MAGAAQAVASSLRDSKAESTHGACAAVRKQFRAWTQDGDHQAPAG